jgi:hypothetical protein
VPPPNSPWLGPHLLGLAPAPAPSPSGGFLHSVAKRLADRRCVFLGSQVAALCLCVALVVSQCPRRSQVRWPSLCLVSLDLRCFLSICDLLLLECVVVVVVVDVVVVIVPSVPNINRCHLEVEVLLCTMYTVFVLTFIRPKFEFLRKKREPLHRRENTQKKSTRSSAQHLRTTPSRPRSAQDTFEAAIYTRQQEQDRDT